MSHSILKKSNNMSDLANTVFTIERNSKLGWMAVRLNIPTVEQAIKEAERMLIDEAFELRVIETNRRIIWSQPKD